MLDGQPLFANSKAWAALLPLSRPFPALLPAVPAVDKTEAHKPGTYRGNDRQPG
ncbi:MAG TPA: hypothetical protein VH682_23680 [Gemmataceae bacterium]